MPKRGRKRKRAADGGGIGARTGARTGAPAAGKTWSSALVSAHPNRKLLHAIAGALVDPLAASPLLPNELLVLLADLTGFDHEFPETPINPTEFVALHPLRLCPPQVTIQFRRVSSAVGVGVCWVGGENVATLSCTPSYYEEGYSGLSVRVEVSDADDPRSGCRFVQLKSARESRRLNIPAAAFNGGCRLVLRYSTGEVLLS